MRSADTLRKQSSLLKTSFLPRPSHTPLNGNDSISETLDHLLTIVEFYAERIAEKSSNGVGNPNDVMKIVADEIETNGIHGVELEEVRKEVPP